jgi:cytochrome subunit of sulfide dehydrogenase
MLRSTIVAAAAAAQALWAAPAAAQSAQAMAQNCFVCHGPAARGSQAITGIAGKPQELIEQQMLAFRSDQRAGTIMNRIAKGYDEAQIAAIAAHLAKLPR